MIGILLLLLVSTEAFITQEDNDISKNWAVLVAGSNGWGNYRHQSDVFHAYQLLRKRGIPAKNIITMAFDDIAYNRNNPYKGKVFNDYEHQDNYAGVIIDYKDKEVNPAMFLRVMSGDKDLKKAGKKVLESGPQDDVFVYFTDHGSNGLIAFPTGILYATQLNDTITYMFENNRYKKMVLYIEACYSGSMFEKILSPDIRVYATTAANPYQSSYAAFCRDRTIKTCLADEYSYNWMIDTEKNNINQRTLKEQFDRVKLNTKGSQVMMYGDLSMSKLKVSEFQSHGNPKVKPVNAALKTENRKPSHRAHLVSSMRQMMDAQTEAEHQFAQRKLQRAIQLGHLVKSTMADIVTDVQQYNQPISEQITLSEQLKCFEAVFDIFQINCFTIQQVPEVAEHLEQLHTLCKTGYQSDKIIESIHHVCI